MSTARWPHLYALLLAKGSTDWRWQRVRADSDAESGSAALWALVQDQGGPLGETLCGVFAIGETLSLQARVLEQVSPALLKDVGERAVIVEEARERVSGLVDLAQQLSTRAYRHKRADEYDDLRSLRAGLQVLLQLLEATGMPALEALEAWDDKAWRESGRGSGSSD